MLISPIFLLLGAAAPAAQSSPEPVTHHWGRIFISPMGEPFRGDDALAIWFNQADLNHDGQLTLAEMQKDADRFFTILDVNHDGEIDPDEITHYEEVVAPVFQVGAHVSIAAGGDGQGGSGAHWHGKGHHRGGGDGSDEADAGGGQGRVRFGLFDLPEPVVAADTDFNRGVSLAEFRAAAAKRFVALDLDHKGILTLAELESIHPPSPHPQPKTSSTPPEDSDLPPPELR